LGWITAPEPAPAGIATFAECLRIQEGNNRYIAADSLVCYGSHEPRNRSAWTMTIPDTLGTSPAVLNLRAAAASAAVARFDSHAAYAPSVRLPLLRLEPVQAETLNREMESPDRQRLAAPAALDYPFATVTSSPVGAGAVLAGVRALALPTGLAELAEPTLAEAGPWDDTEDRVEEAIFLSSQVASEEPEPASDMPVELPILAARELEPPDARLPFAPPAPLETPLPARTPEAAESYIEMSAAAEAAPAIACQTPAFAFAIAGAWVPMCASFALPLAPQAAESFVLSAAAAQPVAFAGAPATLPVFALAPVEAIQAESSKLAAPVEAPAACPVESYPAVAFAPAAVAFPERTAAIQLPSFALTTVSEIPVEPQTLAPAAACAEAQPVETFPSTVFAPAAVAFSDRIAAIQLPSFAQLVPATDAPANSQTAPLAPAAACAQAQPVESMPAMFVPAAVAFTARAIETARVLSIATIEPASEISNKPETLAPAAACAEAQPVESMPAAFAAVPVFASRPLATPAFALAPAAEHGTTVFENPYPQVIEPAAAAAQSPALLEPVGGVGVRVPEPDFPRVAARIPTPGFVSLEFFCQHATGSPLVRKLDWIAPKNGTALPRFALRPLFERLEELAPQKQTNKKPGFAEIFTMPEAQRGRPKQHYAIKAIAAGLMLMGVLWFGAKSLHMTKQMAAVNREVIGTDISIGAPSATAVAVSLRPSSTPKNSTPGLVDRMRGAIAKRAASEVGDTFRAGMEAWGGQAKSYPQGWARNAAGYVNPGALALFQPTHDFQDYRLEFFGQIENKSMSWAVRAQDKQNYHAMKFSVVEAGLRPIIAMVHYDVVSGQKGRKSEIPLNVMVHNNTPYHVAVDVKGNRFTTSIEGQEVDSWTDDALPSGGVGFFADAGEKARLYWMKVTKNQDWLGHFCSYLSGGTVETAELWQPELPMPKPEAPAPKRTEDVTLAAAEPALRSLSSTQRVRISEYRRLQWSS
jgi:hypothetical protein